MPPLLQVEDLTVRVGNRLVVRHADLVVERGEIVLLLGPNGSGKTSLTQAIIGNPRYKLEAGRIIFDGRDVTKLSMEERVRLGLTATWQIPPEIEGITLRELAEEIAKRSGVSRDELLRLAKLLRLEDLMDRDVNKNFSGGERKRAELFLTLLQRPKMVILDEPDSGVDIQSLAWLGHAINEAMKDSLRGVLIITHTAAIAKYVPATRAYVMIAGTIACSGPADLVVRRILESGFKECIRRCRLVSS